MNEINRRTLLVGLAGAGLATGLAGCGIRGNQKSLGMSEILKREKSLIHTGRIQKFNLQAKVSEIDLGGIIARTWTYGDSLPGKLIRINKGDQLQVSFSNRLPVASSVHWHGLAIRNDMDGVPNVTTPEVASLGNFNFDFTVPDSGTFWFHPHSGTQLDRGLYAPLIVDDPNEVVSYELEWIVILDDWTDGVGKNPDEILSALQAGSGPTGDMGGMGGMGGMGDMGVMGDMGGGDVTYPLYLINGHTSNDPEIFSAKPGQKIRIRVINASADTIFDVALTDHPLSITHTDGFPVIRQNTDSFRIGMGERYDFEVTMKDGVFPLVASAVGKGDQARALIRSGAGSVPAARFIPSELSGRPLTSELLRATEEVKLYAVKSNRVQDLVLSGSMRPYIWTMNGKKYEETEPLVVRLGETGTIKIRNRSMMAHPIHLHGHTFQLGRAGGNGARKDTVLVPGMGGINVDYAATNPGKWMIHCHNAYHAEAGMMSRLEYIA